MVVQDEKFLAGILHDVLAEVLDEEAYVRRAAILVMGGNIQRMAAFISEEHLQTAPTQSCQSVI